MNSQAQLSAAQQLASGAGSGMPNLTSSGAGGADDDDDDIPELEAVEEDGNVDETGVDPKDIELVIQQVGCSRAKAVRVLKESGGDLINASEYSYALHHETIADEDVQSWLRASDLVVLHCIITTLLCRTTTLRNLLLGSINPFHACCKSVGKSLLPATQFYEVIGSFPPIRDDLYARSSSKSFRWCSYK